MPRKLADELYGKHLRVAQRGGGSTCSEAPEVLDVVVYEAEDGNDEGAKIHNRRPPLRLPGAIGSTPSVGRSSLSLKSSKKLAHGVSYRLDATIAVARGTARANVTAADGEQVGGEVTPEAPLQITAVTEPGDEEEIDAALKVVGKEVRDLRYEATLVRQY